MKNAKLIFQEIVAGITLQDSQDEIRSIASILVEKVLGLSKTDILAGKMISVTPEANETLRESLARLNNDEPIQYVLSEACFFGRNFYVDQSVLIPRPESEELVRVVLSFVKKKRSDRTLKILDIGTGSGCLAITLSLEVAGAEVYATDVSPAALSVASRNAEAHGAAVTLIDHDILLRELPLAGLDVIVSNPPYIPLSERVAMKANVLDFEPDLALFVRHDDPLIFYREIARKGWLALTTGGLLVVEINERFGTEVTDVLVQSGFTGVDVVPDVAGKDRVVKALKTL